MLFNSIEFVVFLPVVVAVFFLLPLALRPSWLALASYYFYMVAHPEFGWILFGCTAVAYVTGLLLEQWSDPLRRRIVLGGAILANFGVLGYFKYADLLLSTLNRVARGDLPLLHLVLPVGISFFTFQAVSYCIDVYRGHFPAERRFDIFAAYKAFFPQLVAGPIERPGNVVPQLKRKASWSVDRAASGLQLMLWGYFKKLVIADRLAIYIKDIYTAPDAHGGFQLLLATYAFAFQIFCDFSAYTDIARGCARILGIDLMENFRAPYLSRSIPEFWGRWHISLSTWFRDYLYIPLGGNRVPWFRWQINLVIVFLVSGIWHGADWKFAVWGGLHALYFLVANALARFPWRASLPTALQWLRAGVQVVFTFHLVVFAWIFFRAGSLSDAFLIVRKIATHPLQGTALTPAFHRTDLWIALGAIALLESVHLLRLRVNPREFLARQPLWIRWPAYYALIIAVVLFAVQGQQDFIYFQF